MVVAHVFGARMDMDKVIAAVRRCNKDAVVVEDAAEAFEGLHYKGHDAADVSLFSFGTIKTATAFGGCMMRVKDDATRRAIKRLHFGYPLQRRPAYVAKLLKYAAAASLLTPAAFGVAKRAIALTGGVLPATHASGTAGAVDDFTLPCDSQCGHCHHAPIERLPR